MAGTRQVATPLAARARSFTPRVERARLVRLGKGLVGIAVAIAIWELVRAAGMVPRDFVPGIGSILQALVDNLGSGLLEALGHTVTAWAVGMLITVAIGGALGVALGLSRVADAAGRVVVDFLRPIPSVALIPVAILIFGIGLRMQLVLIVFACVWPVMFNVRYGVRSVDPLLLDTARVAGLSRAARIRRVVLPWALPAIFTGVRISSSIALVLAVSSEMISGSPGLGKIIVDADGAGNFALAYAGALVTGLFGFLLNVGLVSMDRRLLPWSVAARGDSA
jgi:ABC-type nitrate/sulfonate/bicarbonate transport system permease component